MLDTTKRFLEKEYKEHKKGFIKGTGWSKKRVASKMKAKQLSSENERRNDEVKRKNAGFLKKK